MGLLNRRTAVPSTAPDQTFPFWSAADADRFRKLVQDSFLRVGTPVTIHPDHVVDLDGKQFGLANLAANCHHEGRGPRAWRGLIRRHVEVLTSTMNGNDFERLSDVEVLRSTYCRLMPSDDVPPIMSYATDFASGIAQVFNLDLPRTVQWFTDTDVARFDETVLLRAGLDNLRTVKVEEHERLRQSGGEIDVLIGQSIFTASLLLLLGEVVERYGRHLDPRLGVFVAAPNRHQLDFHVLRDTTAVPSLQLLAGFAAAGYRDVSGQLSPSVYWWRPGRIEEVSRATEDGGITVEIGAGLAEVLDSLPA